MRVLQCFCWLLIGWERKIKEHVGYFFKTKQFTATDHIFASLQLFFCNIHHHWRSDDNDDETDCSVGGRDIDNGGDSGFDGGGDSGGDVIVWWWWW